MTTLNKITLLVVLFSVYSIAQISITSTNFTYTQDFNTLNPLYGPHKFNNNITLPGWYLYNPSIQPPDTVTYTGQDGGEGPGLRCLRLNNQAVDLALGSCSVNEYWGLSFINNAGISINNIPIEYTGEQWRAVNNSSQYLEFAYSKDALSIDDNTATWIVVPELRFYSIHNFIDPAVPLDGNLAINQQIISSTINLELLDGETIWFRWKRNSVLPKWHGLAIDDFKFNPNGQALPVELSSFSAAIIGTAVKLKWTTDTEINNYGFEIERSTPLYPLSRGEAEGRGVWKTIGFVNGNGNSNSPKDYSFVDNAIPENTNTLYYRLKQIDNDGQFEYSEIVEISFNKPMDFSLNQNYPNPFNPGTSILYSIASSQYVQLKVYDMLGNEVAALVDEFKPAGNYEISFSATGGASQLGSGIYFYRLEAGSFYQTRKMIILK